MRVGEIDGCNFNSPLKVLHQRDKTKVINNISELENRLFNAFVLRILFLTASIQLML